MHENREISSAPSAVSEGRSVKAHSRTTDMYVLEKSVCAVLPLNRPNKGGATSCGGRGGKITFRNQDSFALEVLLKISRRETAEERSEIALH
jgi:hypothetical protein